MALTAFSLLPISSLEFSYTDRFISQRPPLNKRTFTSDMIESQIVKIKSVIKDKELAWMFENCYPERVQVEIQGVRIDFIDLKNLKTNKF